MNDIYVVKRNGEKELFDPQKINTVVERAIGDLKDVSLSDIIINAKLNIYNGIRTNDIQTVLVTSAISLFNENAINYQKVARNLLNFQIRKNVWGSEVPPSFYNIIKVNVENGIYDPDFLISFSKDEIDELEKKIDHSRDFNFDYTGLKQLCDKYLLKNKKTDQIYETPQFMYMLVAMASFCKYPTHVRLSYIKKTYDKCSLQKINLPTPQIAGIRTTTKQYSSCCLLEIGDSMDSIGAAWEVVGKATAKRFGIGLGFSNIRAIGTEIRNGEVLHTGVIPFLKTFESIVKSCHQNGVRGGSASVFFNWWHYEIMDILPLKNNGGTDDNRVRKLDYGIVLNKTFYTRYMQNKDITLFSPHEVPELVEAMALDTFDEVYSKCEKSSKIKYKKKINARTLMDELIKERTETGRIYILNVDLANQHGPWIPEKAPVYQSNLCLEIVQPTKPLKYLNDPEGEVGVCVLSAINVLNIKDDKDLFETCDIIVRMLDELIDNQEYLLPAFENFVKNRRSLGIGITNLAAYLAKNGYSYDDEDAPNFVDELMEKIQYNLLSVSCTLAEEKGACPKFNETKYSLGIMPLDRYKKSIDEFVTRAPSKDWESLRERILKFGLRHSTLTAQMPCESSSLTSSSTNGIEPVRELLSYKTSKSGTIPILVPEHKKWKYTKAFNMSNEGYLKIVGTLQKWIDMGISTNSYYRYSNYENNSIPNMELIKHIFLAYRLGIKTLYYCNTDDSVNVQEFDSCESGACSV